ncbi:helix-turn-helix protein [Rhodopseudomonas faecalis]|uniref:Helix-turn-helix protein n=2 Tax=Rhodopseudomonas faecalis TaxID=99655 RepID=A0A318TKR7_9BRAD|nr:helix-turn-helix protein [Rhodopseudomonas faecalis]
MSQDDLGEIVQVSHAAVQQWEKDKTKPSIDNLTAAAEALEVPLAWLTSGVGPAPDLTPPEPKGRRSWRNARPSAQCVSFASRIPEVQSRSLASQGSAQDADKAAIAHWCIPADVVRNMLHTSADALTIMRVTRPTAAPAVNAGDYVVVDRSRTEVNEPGLWVVLAGGAAFLCRAEVGAGPAEGGISLMLTTADGSLPPMHPSNPAVKLVGRAAGHFRAL